ncbi:hypothetical protein B0A55_10415 [Friedmanniomyces simplex]|uniref:NADP-dependent oxidoreductase domain-containing protein n=1 Tax=Friedmanniomyces simplex TaxID=329884 RepID=A0A4U0WMW3_9PEZI|nr:hypothetical protein B0A55_10415 [Friedmanniomyces simplex]
MTYTIAGKHIGRIGFGMGGFLHAHRQIPVDDAIATMKAALEAGATFWNAGEIYGTPDYNTLHLLNAYFTRYPHDADKVFISVKGCLDLKTAQLFVDKAGVKRSIDNCLLILDGKCRIDLFEAARGGLDVPIEETVGAIAEYVKAGAVGSIGLSECSAATIRRAVAVHPIAAVEIELSLFATDIFGNGVAAACAELGIPLIAYSPLGKGILTGQLRKPEDVTEGDYRRFFPRFQAEALEENVKLVDEVKAVAERKGCTVAQVAIAWVAARGKKLGVPVVPIPGATTVTRMRENTAAAELTDEELKEIDGVLENAEVKGGRAPAMFARFLEV